MKSHKIENIPIREVILLGSDYEFSSSKMFYRL